MRGEERGTREGTKSEPEVWRTYGQILVELIQHQTHGPGEIGGI